MTPRNCPRCDIPPARIYDPYTYTLKGKERTIQQSYCSNCKKTFAQQGRSAKKPRILKSTPKRKTLRDLTLADIIKQIDNGDTRWLDDRRGTRWQALRIRVLERDNYLCQIRGNRCDGKANQVDHIDPNGDSHPYNLRAACGPCNGSRFQTEQRCCLDCGSTNVGRLYL